MVRTGCRTGLSEGRNLESGPPPGKVTAGSMVHGEPPYATNATSRRPVRQPTGERIAENAPLTWHRRDPCRPPIAFAPTLREDRAMRTSPRQLVIATIALVLLGFGAATQSPQSKWRLVWSDEFAGATLDYSKWGVAFHALGGGNVRYRGVIRQP